MSYFDTLVKQANGKAVDVPVNPNLPRTQQGFVDPTMARVMRDDMVDDRYRYMPWAEDRIRELDEEIAKYKQELASYDTESEMGKYKFVWEGDPSTYTTVQQNKRNAEETRKIREASEAATKASNAQTAWKQLALNLEEEKYKLASAQNRVNEALATGNRSAYVEAMTDVKRSEAALTRFQREQAEYRKKFADMLGVALEDDTKAQDVAYDVNGDKNIAGIDTYEALKANLAKGKNNLRSRPKNMSGKEKSKIIKEANNNLANFRQTASGLTFLNPQTKSELDKMITEYEDSIPKFKKGQGTVMTQEAFNKMGYAQLKALGLKTLRNYNNQFGAGYPDKDVLEKALKNAE